MKTIVTATSSNSPYAQRLCVRAPKGTKFPAQGRWIDRGELGRERVIEFHPAVAGHWCCWVGGQTLETEGVAVAASLLGAHTGVQCLYLRPSGASFRLRGGYKYRRESFWKFDGSTLSQVEAAELAPAGTAIEPDWGDEPQSDPEPLGVMAAAMRSAGLTE